MEWRLLYNTPAALAKHVQAVLFEAATASQLKAVRNAFLPGQVEGRSAQTQCHFGGAAIGLCQACGLQSF